MKKISLIAAAVIFVFSCASSGEQDPVRTALYVDLERFMGDWYVVALLPTPFEKNIANGVENYRLNDKGEILVTYTYRKGSPEGKEKVMRQKGWIVDDVSNAEWRVRPLWPLKLPYYVLEVGGDYDYTVIGTDSLDYLWIMSREPAMDGAELEEIIARMGERGYDREKIQFMEQEWG